MTRRALALAALALALAPPAALAQSAADYLPREPGADRPAPDRRSRPTRRAAARPAPPPADAGPPSSCAASRSRARPRSAPRRSRRSGPTLIGQPVIARHARRDRRRASAPPTARAATCCRRRCCRSRPSTDGVVRIQVIEGFIDRVARRPAAPPASRRRPTRLFAPVAADRPLRLRHARAQRAARPRHLRRHGRDRARALARHLRRRRSRPSCSSPTASPASPPPTTAARGSTAPATRQRRRQRLQPARPATSASTGSSPVAPHDTSLAYGQAVLDLPLPVLDRHAARRRRGSRSRATSRAPSPTWRAAARPTT